MAVGIIPTRQKTRRRKKVRVSKPPGLHESKKDPPRWVFFVGTVLLATNIDIALLGVSKAMGKIDRGFGMVTAHPSGFMMVNPDFSEEAAPDFIQVTVAYRKPFANNLSIEKLKELVTRAKLELAPEYNVMGDVEEHEGGKAIFFTITK